MNDGQWTGGLKDWMAGWLDGWRTDQSQTAAAE